MRGKLAITREHTGDRQADAIQESASKTARRANACPFLEGRLVTVQHRLAVGADGYIIVPHGLGSRAAFIIVRCVGGIIEKPFEAGDQTGLDPTVQMRVGIDVVDGDPVVDFWFYAVASKRLNQITGIGV